MAPSSTRKDSVSSATDTIPLDASPQYQPAQPTGHPTTPPCRRNPKSGWAYPRDSPGRSAFLTARALNVLLTTVLFVLAFPAERVAHRGRWMSAVLSPAINAWIANAIDLAFVLRRNVRSHPLQRLLWDGALAVGFGVSAGFMVWMTRGDITRTAADSSDLSAALGVVMLLCLFSVFTLEFGIAIGGGKEWIAIRRARRAPQVVV